MTSWIEIDPFALIHNVRTIRQIVGDLPIWAVVKANGYGHDLAIASEAFWRGGVNGWVVAATEEAEWLSQERYQLPILILLPVEEKALSMASEPKWHLAVTSSDYFDSLEFFVRTSHTPLTIQLEIETGMHRTGLAPIVAERIIERLQEQDLPFQLAGLWTHLYDPTNREVSNQQIAVIKELQFALQRKGLPVPPTHVLASDGLALYRDTALFDGVRLGKSLYGFCSAFPELSGALSWKTRVAATGELKPGETVGYGATFRATRPAKIATLPIGYADGLDHRLSNTGEVLVAGRRCPIIGLISMNMTTVDISGVLKVERGQEVVVIGRQGNAALTIAEVAARAKILDYDLVTGINPKIKRHKTSSLTGPGS